MRFGYKMFASVLIALMGFTVYADSVGMADIEILEAEVNGRTWSYYVVANNTDATVASTASISSGASSIWSGGGGTTATTYPSAYAIIIGVTPADGDVVIPDSLPSYNDNSLVSYYTVSGIGDCAFKGCNELTKIYMHDLVIAIGDCAFENCTSLTNVTMSAKAIAMGRKVFSGCTALEYVKLPNCLLSRFNSKMVSSYEELRPYHYWSSAVSPECLCNVDGSFFAEELTEPMDIGLFDDINPNLVIESYEEGSSISVEFKESEIDGKTWRYYVRTEANTAASMLSGGGTTTSTDASTTVFYGAVVLGVTPAIGVITIPDIINGHTVVGIGDNAFNNCVEMTGIELPTNIIYIGSWAFYNCKGLTAIDIEMPATMSWPTYFYGSYTLASTIGDGVFYGCNNLNRIRISDGFCQKIPQICPYYYTSTRNSYWNQTQYYADIDTSGMTIGQELPLIETTKDGFTVVLTSGEIDVVSFDINGDRPVATMNGAFCSLGYWMGSIEPSYTDMLPDDTSATSSGWGRNVASLAIDERVALIGHGFFDEFVDLEELVIPNSVEYIVSRCNTNQVDRSQVERYFLKYYFGWNDWELNNNYGSSFEFGEDEEARILDLVATLAQSAFENCNNLKKLTIPQCVCSTNINDVFLTGWKTVQEVTIADGVTYIDDLTFKGWRNLQKVIIPASVTRIGANAFKDCGKLEKIIFEGDAPDVGVDAFIGTPKAMVFEIAEGTIGWDGGLSSEVPEAWNGRRIAIGGSSGSGTGGGAGGGGTIAPAASEVYLTVTNVVVHYILNSVVPEVAVPVSEDTGFVTVVTEIKGGAVSIPETWKADDAEFVEKFGSDFAAALTKPTGKKDAQGNPLMVWQDFVAGTDPTDENDVFTASITMVDGEVKISYTPELSEEEAAKRKYVTYGKASLQDEDWQVVDGNADDFNFFKVTVEMR